EFHTLLVRTYANSLTAFQDQKVSFKPMAEPAAGGEVTVRSQINKPGNQPITLNYSLAKSVEGWKVFDVSIANVSIVTNYRSTFASEMEKSGLDGLLKALREKNRHNEGASSPPS
ncbi:MAG: ABC transporter substrate-binding protein, partial [Betaproteobacteria bacterium]